MDSTDEAGAHQTEGSANKKEDAPNKIEKKWGRVIKEAGWTAAPSILLDKQHALRLKPIDLNVLLQLMKYWWTADEPPFPSKETLATAIGKDPRTIQRSLTFMEKHLKLIERKKRPGPTGTNAITFRGLIAALEPHALAALEERKDKIRKKEELRRQRRARPARSPKDEG